MRICVIGAGVAGIVAAKYVSTSGYECDILESSSQIGGTWVYSDRIGIDQFGFPFYSAMYEGLRLGYISFVKLLIVIYEILISEPIYQKKL